MTFKINRETKKALNLSDGKVTFWVQRRWLRDDGTLTPAGEKAHAKAAAGEKTTGKAYYKVKYAELREISYKAVVVKCFDGSSDVLPKSQIREMADAIMVPCWLAEKKNLQFAAKKIWLEN